MLSTTHARKITLMTFESQSTIEEQTMDEQSTQEAKAKRSFRVFGGLGVIMTIYVILAVTAALFYPNGYSPLTKTLSQLGNSKFNPAGAIFYNAGVFLVSGSTIFLATALLILPKQWLTPRGGSRRTMFYLSVSAMVLFGLFLFLTALFPADANDALNVLFTLVFLVCLELFVVFSSLGIRRMKDHILWLPPFGFFVSIANLLFVAAFVVMGYAIFSWVSSIITWSYMLAFVYEFSYVE